jgi:hypothetical protein
MQASPSFGKSAGAPPSPMKSSALSMTTHPKPVV